VKEIRHESADSFPLRPREKHGVSKQSTSVAARIYKPQQMATANSGLMQHAVTSYSHGECEDTNHILLTIRI
jgi:hypothetical protein